MSLYDVVLKFRRFPRLAKGGVFVLLFAAILLVFAGAGVMLVQRDVNQRVSNASAASAAFMDTMGKTMEALHGAPNATPCSDEFLLWMRHVALLPDGIHEIAYTQDDSILCTVTNGRLATPIPMGAADYQAPVDDSIRIWFRRDMGMLGFTGVTGTFISSGDFLLVVPKLTLTTPMPDGTLYEIISPGADGSVWHSAGEYGLYTALTGRRSHWELDRAFPEGFSASGCDSMQATCIAVLEPFGPLLRRSATTITGAVLLAALLAGAIAHYANKQLDRAWSLPARLRRRLSMNTTACRYQPLLEVATDRIWGVEVLARWQDDDGTLVAPNEFLPIIEKYNLRSKFTRYVVSQAYKELRTLPIGDRPLKVHFNIFPCEFTADWMLELFGDFLADKDRFEVIIELVESDLLPMESTRRHIARLAKVGIKTFIDDFGEGYSSIGYLAGLGSHGVKLDRSFGLSPSGSLMEAMMMSAIDMVDKTGQILVVEGVETANRLAALKETGQVDIVQGYFLSRPIDIHDLKPLLIEGQFWSTRQAA